MQEIMDDVTPEELELWSGSRRKAGKPSKASIESYDRRDAKIVQVALDCTKVFSQTIRHIYYLCSSMGLVGKDHGNKTYWYEMVKNAVGEARWNETLPWGRIADDSRPFNRPVFWKDHSAFLESAIPQFAMDRWEGQDTRVIVCVEKDAIMSMLSGLCSQFHVPIMSFHGQASDGGAVYELAKHLAELKGKCRFVKCLYLGDFDTCGCVIDRVTFGDSGSPDSTESNGKVRRLLWQLTDYADDVPCVMYERIGITPSDVMDQRYATYLLEANADTNFDRYLQDVQRIEGFPNVEAENRGMVPATLGVDALGHEELIKRTKAAIKSCIDVDAWKMRRDLYKMQRRELQELL